MSQKILFSWSGGKDSSMAFYELKQKGAHEVVALLTTVTEGYDRISMHGIRNVLLDQQAEMLGVPVEKVFITQKATMEECETKIGAVMRKYQSQGVSAVAIGDIFLEDLRRYREDNLAKIGMKGVFPVWKRDTKELSKTFIDLGFKAIITCVDSEVLDGKFVGRDYDYQFLADLPSHIDPCGENGEFHSFVYDGPIFSNAIPCEKGERVLRDKRFWFCDVLPV